METWEDCIASLRAGAEPELVLPRIRELFSRLPERPAGSSKDAEKEEAEKHPTANLYHTLEGAGDYVFQLPYLRPPFFLWDSIKRASGEYPDERETLFDSELDIDLFAQFEPRFVDPPSDEVRKLLKEQNKWDDPDRIGDDGSEDDLLFQDLRKEKPALEGRQTRRKYCSEDIARFSSHVAMFMLSAKSTLESDDNTDALPTFPPLSLEEWSLIFSGLESSVDISPHALTRFLLFVNQPSLAMLSLQTVFPFLIANNMNSKDVEVLTTLVSAAASMAELDKLPTTRVRALLHIYRGTDGGILSALAQLRIVINTKKGC